MTDITGIDQRIQLVLTLVFIPLVLTAAVAATAAADRLFGGRAASPWATATGEHDGGP